MDIPVFTGSHADLLVVVFHKIITTGHQRLQPLFDCLLTILVNVSPYLKTLSMVASTKLLHLLEAFSTPWFLFSQAHHHHLVFFLLEMFNNMIQYQFDGNSNLVYTIIRKRAVFHNLANLPHEHTAIARSLAAGRAKGLVHHKTTLPSLRQPAADRTPLHLDAHANGAPSKPVLPARRLRSRSAESVAETPMEGSRPAQPAEPGTLNPTLAETPAISTMTERESAHPPPQRLESDAVTPTDAADAADTADASTTAHDGDGDAREPRDRLLPARAGPDGEDRPDDVDMDDDTDKRTVTHRNSLQVSSTGRQLSEPGGEWRPTAEWVSSWRGKLPLQTIMRLLQVLVPQVEKICIDKCWCRRSRRYASTSKCCSTAVYREWPSGCRAAAADHHAPAAGAGAAGREDMHRQVSAVVLQYTESGRVAVELPLQTIMRLLQVLVPQVEKICIDKCWCRRSRRYASTSKCCSTAVYREWPSGCRAAAADHHAPAAGAGAAGREDMHRQVSAVVLQYTESGRVAVELPLQTIMRLLQVLVPQVEKICIDKCWCRRSRRYASTSKCCSTAVYREWPSGCRAAAADHHAPAAGAGAAGREDMHRQVSAVVLQYTESGRVAVELPLQTIMRLLQVLVPQVEKICIDKCWCRRSRRYASTSKCCSTAVYREWPSGCRAAAADHHAPAAGAGAAGREDMHRQVSAVVLQYTESGRVAVELPLQTIMRLLQVLVPQVEKICIDKCWCRRSRRYASTSKCCSTAVYREWPSGCRAAAADHHAPAAGAGAAGREDMHRQVSAVVLQYTESGRVAVELPLQTIMRLLQVLVPQVEKICIDKGLTDESEILRFLQHGTLVGLLPVPHPILIRKYQANAGTAAWFRTYLWGVIYIRNVDPPIWYDTDVKLFEIQRV
ncbi:hypothetical protein PYW07_004273 [Mythimna separata]|uniref:Protein HID1 n=1 Tax=Mythimna separata TaxID=271217 RepID=A0AAD7YWM3_MYTSE|nr:hypothetical protein PYW07_004273 [Mythimna separata]